MNNILNVNSTFEKRVTKSVTILPNVWIDFKNVADKKGVSVSRMIEEFMINYIEEYNKVIGEKSVEV